MNAINDRKVCTTDLFEFTDEELLVEYRNFGNIQYFNEIVERYREPLKNYLFSHYQLSFETIEELLQSTFMRVWQKCDQFDLTQRFQPWIYSIAITQAINLWRKSKMSVNSISLDGLRFSDNERSAIVLSITSREPDPTEEIERQDCMNATRRLVKQLPMKSRQAIELVFYQGLTLKRAAEFLGVAIATVWRRIKMALEFIRTHLIDGKQSGSLNVVNLTNYNVA